VFSLIEIKYIDTASREIGVNERTDNGQATVGGKLLRLHEEFVQMYRHDAY